MPSYEYKAGARDGTVVSGKIDAADIESLKTALRGKGLFPIEIKRESILKRELDISFFAQKIKTKDLFILCKQLGSLLNAGVTVLDSLSILRQQTENKTMVKILTSVLENVQKGNSLSASIAYFPSAFPPIFLHMVEAGELSGSLELSFERLAEHFEKESKTTNKIKGALTYPVVVLCFAVIAVVAVVVFVIPKFAETFESIGAEMPFFTRMLMGISDFTLSYWYIVLAAVTAFVVCFRIYAGTKGGKLFLSRLTLKIPYVGVLNLKVAASRFARTLSTMMSSGLSLFVALDITGKVVGNHYIQKGLGEVSEKVSQGSGMAEPLEEIGIFPPMVTHMVKVGESTGEMEQLLRNTAAYYDDEVETAVTQLTSVMEPLIILVLGVVVVIIVLAVFMPILSMYDAVG